MRVAYVTAGAGGMLCGSCIRDNALARALGQRGHDVVLAPIYTPLRTDEESVAGERVFYGAVNVYLEQKLPGLRRMPEVLHRWLARPGLLRAATSSARTIDARLLGELTLSMLAGEDGRQARELEELGSWLERDLRPDLIHLTNSMLLGMAAPLKARTGVPVVCALQGEDIFLDDLEQPWRARVHDALRRRAGDADLLIATCRYYADHMAAYLEVPRERVEVARIGISLEGHGEAVERPDSGSLNVGYLARICPEKGLHDLVAAFGRLVERMPDADLRLRVAGYLGGRDAAYFERVKKQVGDAGLGPRFEYLGEVDRAGKIELLRGLDVLSVPTVYREPKGLFVLEALANGVPVVLPAHGAFPELIEATGGGVLVEPGSVDALASGIEGLLRDRARRRELGARGREAVMREYSADAAAAETEKLWEGVLAAVGGASDPAAAERPGGGR
ncbi:MAG TPA: glycosyltransferase family 4 protein [Thermoanaerobaculia bacterium]|nr:glycosyltransferase family 4 protein [Thermoanaerobaculia bacterium]